MEVKNEPVVYFPKKIEVVPVKPVQAEEPQEQPKQEQPEKITKENLIDKMESMNEFLTSTPTSLKFQLHEESNSYYVQVIDTVTDEILKEIPNRKFLDMYASMAEFAGLLVDEKL